MASHWLYCCRLGTQDPRGSLAATRVLGDKRCHGTTKYKMSLTELAIRWAQQRSAVTSTLLGHTSMAQLDETLAFYAKNLFVDGGNPLKTTNAKAD